MLSPTDVQVTEVDGFASVSWIYDANDADGYVVYFNNYTERVEGGNMTEIALCVPAGSNYTITVRAYQDILGPPSIPIEYTKG